MPKKPIWNIVRVFPSPKRPEAQRLQQGAILVRPAGDSGSFPVPAGLIHDWIGTVFIPHVSLRDVLARIRSYEEYPEML